MHKLLLDFKKGPRHWYNELVQAKMAPNEIALGFSVGIFCTLLALPIINLFLALAAMAFLRINKIAVMLGYIIIIFPLSPLTYYTSLRIGFLIFGYKAAIPENITFSMVKDYGLAFAVGNLTLSVGGAALSFLLVYSIAKSIEIIKKRRSNQASLLKSP